MIPQSSLGWLVLGLCACALATLPLVASSYHTELATTALVAAMLALSLQLLVGVTGMVSLGHGALYGVAAYTVFLMSPKDAGLPIWMTLPAAVAMSSLAALAMGALALRTQGFFFLMVTLALGQMIFFVFHDTALGGGTDGAYLAKPTLSLFGYDLTLTKRQRPSAIYWLALAQLVMMFLGLSFIVRSSFGRALAGIKSNESRMRSLGFDVDRLKLVAFVIAGGLSGVAGHMWALHRGFVNPELAAWHRSAEALLMILLGGLDSLAGPILGALAFTALGEIAQTIAESTWGAQAGPAGAAVQSVLGRKVLIEGLVILIAVLVLPKGLAGLARWPRRRIGPAAPSVGKAEAATHAV